MNEKEILVEISRIAGDAETVVQAADQIQARLAIEVGNAMILLRSAADRTSLFQDNPVAEFMESREFPFRGLYIEPLVVGGEKAGTLVACFGSWGAKGEFLQRATAHISEQLAVLLGRTPSGAPFKGVAA